MSKITTEKKSMEPEKEPQEKAWACYCLVSSSGSTYIGSTVDIDRRLRQHNREIKGGARATGRAEGWERVCHVLGFPDERAALQFEWAWKHFSRKAVGSTPLERRCHALVALLNKEKSTSKAVPFSSYNGPLVIFIEDHQMMSWFDGKEVRYGILTLTSPT